MLALVIPSVAHCLKICFKKSELLLHVPGFIEIIQHIDLTALQDNCVWKWLLKVIWSKSLLSAHQTRSGYSVTFSVKSLLPPRTDLRNSIAYCFSSVWLLPWFKHKKNLNIVRSDLCLLSIILHRQQQSDTTLLSFDQVDADSNKASLSPALPRFNRPFSPRLSSHAMCAIIQLLSNLHWTHFSASMSCTEGQQSRHNTLYVVS